MDGLETARRLIAQERERKTGFLDLGKLGLTELPQELFELTHLQALHLGNYCYVDGKYQMSANSGKSNTVFSLPHAVERLESLRHLTLSKGFSSLEVIRGLPALQSLYCSGTQVSDLTPLQGLPALQSLNCSRTPVSDLTPLKGLSALQSLNCWSTPVSDLTPLKGLPALQSLDYAHTPVSDLTPLKGLPALQSLNYAHTPVSDLTPLRGLSALQSLNCWSTPVGDLTPLKGLPALQWLNCWSTPVSDLTPLKGLLALQSLVCSGTPVSDLSPLQGLSALQKLDCSGTPVSDFSPLKRLTALQTLNCSNTPVSDLTPLKGLPALQSLDCAGTPVSDLSPLKGLSALQKLRCSRTQIKDLSPLKGLTALQKLDCSDTPVSDLTPLKGLPALQSLNCSNTPVSDFSPLKRLTALQSLSCAGTPVSDLSALKGLSALQSLRCSRTQVKDLSPLAAVSSLKELRANLCELRDFPSPLLSHPALENLCLYETKIPGVPPEVLSERDSDNCLERLRNHVADLRAGVAEVRETKIIALGNGRVGKTQICRKLRGLPFDPGVRSTHGITVTSEPWTGSTKKERLNIWDFGGQDIYHGAHTLFMRTRAVFLVVWHPDFETAREHEHEGLVFRNYPLSYWLEYVRTLGRPDSPVIVVQSQCDRPELETKRLPVDERFMATPFFKQCWYSAAKDRGRRALDEAIEEAIKHLRNHEGVAIIGKGRMKVLRQLEKWRNADQKLPPSKRQHRTLTQTEFRNLCKKAGGVASPGSLLEFLHNAGVVFYRDKLFHDRIILDQSWALDAVYAVFDRTRSFRQITSQGGRFKRSLLELMVWGDYSEAEKQLFLSLMASCGICFVYRQENEQLMIEAEYIAPDLLPDKASVAEQLAGRWNDQEESRRLVFEYEFLHSGLIRGLICDAGGRAGEAGVYWKYGVWVYEKATGCRALIEQEMTDDRRGRITARIQGRLYEELAWWIRNRFEERNRLFGYPDLKPIVDEFDSTKEGLEGKGIVKWKRITAADKEATLEAARTTAQPVFVDPPAASFPKQSPQVFVSYAWGDSTQEGKRREKLVDDLCGAAHRQGFEILRDREQMRVGERISEFMKRLTEGDLIITVISDKYLRSPYCMYELYRVYERCDAEPARFLDKVIPLVLPDARLKEVSDRFAYAVHWKQERTKLEKLLNGNVDVLGKEALGKFRMMQDFAHHVSDILEHLVDKLMPRDFDRMTADGFKEVLELIGKGSNRRRGL